MQYAKPGIPDVGRKPYALDQKRIVMQDSRTKRNRARAAQKRRAIRNSY